MSVAPSTQPAPMLGELKLHRLLVAIDGSANAELALSAAITAARRDNATLTLLTVGPDIAAGPAAWSIPVTGTVDQEAIDKDVPVPTLTAALFTRFRSRQEESFAEKMLAALRNAFGGHSVRR